MKTGQMRDPAGSVSKYTEIIESHVKSGRSMQGGRFKALLETRLLYHFRDFEFSEKAVVYQYGAGRELADIRLEVLSRIALMHESSEFLRGYADHPQTYDPYPLGGTNRGALGFFAIALLVTESSEFLVQLRQLIPPDSKRRSYFLDILTKPFIPDFELAKNYKMDQFAAVWMIPILRSLAMSGEERTQALANHLNRWCQIMRPWGWKPDLDPVARGDNLFCHFSFELALAVCAYDLDDRSFSDNPYYPRDLVEYYRANVRHTRDAWRAEGVGPGVPVKAPPPSKKADLAKSKRKAFARWVELVCDGDIDATEAVLETIGKPRKVEDINELMESLADSSQAIEADIKDDETTLLQAAKLAEQRALGDFDGPPGPPFGPARCSAGLLAFAHWLQPRGYRLVDLDNDDDAWHAVVVKTEYHAELIELSNILNIRTHAPEAIYQD
jgi:hypothetical protein